MNCIFSVCFCDNNIIHKYDHDLNIFTLWYIIMRKCLKYSGLYKTQDSVILYLLHISKLLLVFRFKRVVSRIIFASPAQNVCLQHERKHVDAGDTSPTAHSMNSAIQTVHAF